MRKQRRLIDRQLRRIERTMRALTAPDLPNVYEHRRALINLAAVKRSLLKMREET